jgi:hypothetical protein
MSSVTLPIILGAFGGAVLIDLTFLVVIVGGE